MLARLLRIVLLVGFIASVATTWGLAQALDLSILSSSLVVVGLMLVVPAIAICPAFLLAHRRIGNAAPSTSKTDWWGALGSELIAIWILYLWRQPLASRLPVPGARDPGGNDAQGVPVLLVHGFVCNHRLWDPMVCALRRRGHPTRRVDLEPVFGSIDDYAQRIEAAVAALLSQTGTTRLAIVAHSMGGLAVRAWLRSQPDRLRNLDVVVTLGTPHAGTLLRAPAFAVNAAQMRYRSAWLSALARSESADLRDRFRVCLTLHDEIVFPQVEQFEAGMRVHRIVGLGHLAMTRAPSVIDWTLLTIAESSRADRVPE